MPALDNLPTDKLYKFLTVLGLALVMASVVLPVSAVWQLQVQRNQAAGEEAEYLLQRDALVAECMTLKANGEKVAKQMVETSSQMDQVLADLRKSTAASTKGLDSVGKDEVHRLMKILPEFAQLLADLGKLEDAEQPDEVAIRTKFDEIDNLTIQLTKEMPSDLADALRSALKALRLSNEVDRLASAAKPDKTLIDRKTGEFTAAYEESKKKMNAVSQSFDEKQNQKRADVMKGAFHSFAHHTVLLTNLLRLENLARETGLQMTEKTTSLLIAETKIITKKNELDIIGRHNTIAIVGGVLVLLVGLSVSGFGFWWWYTADRSTNRDVPTADAAAGPTAGKGK